MWILVGIPCVLILFVLAIIKLRPLETFMASGPEDDSPRLEVESSPPTVTKHVSPVPSKQRVASKRAFRAEVEKVTRVGRFRPDLPVESDSGSESDKILNPTPIELQAETTHEAPPQDNGLPENQIPAIVPPTPKSETTTKKRPLKYDLAVPRLTRDAPILVMLHGAGGKPSNWKRWGNAAQSAGYIACAPQASKKPGVRRWDDSDIPGILEIVDRLTAKLGGDPNRVYIMGFSNGGFWSVKTALLHPETFAAVVSIGGGNPLREYPETAVEMGVCLIHGTHDRIVPIASSRSTANRLRTAGFEHVVLNEIEGGRHELFELPEVFDWLSKFSLE